MDRFPNLKIVIGHMGEALPYFMYRLDYGAGAGQRFATAYQRVFHLKRAG